LIDSNKVKRNTGVIGGFRQFFKSKGLLGESTYLVIKVLLNLERIWKKEDKTGGFFYTFGTVLDLARVSRLKSCTESENA
jgi:hypothetical protein